MKTQLVILIIVLSVISCKKENHNPVIQNLDCAPNDRKAGTIFSLTVTATDADGDALQYQWTADGGEFTEPTNGSQTKWKSPLDGVDKSFNISVTVSDGKSTANSIYQIKLNKNNSPIITRISSTPESAIGGTVFLLKVVASDPDKDSLLYKWSCLGGELIDGDDKTTVNWKSPVKNVDTTYIIKVTVFDRLSSVDGTHEIVVTGNAAPIISKITSTPPTGVGGTIFSLKAVASDPENDSLAYKWTSDGGGFPDGDNLAIVNWKSPASNLVKKYNLKVTVSDGLSYSYKSLQISVAKNNSPIIKQMTSTPETGTGGTIFSLNVDASDPDNDPLTYKWTSEEGVFTEGDTLATVKWKSLVSDIDKLLAFRVKVSDGLNSVENVIEIGVLSNAPTISQVIATPPTGVGGTIFSLRVVASDPDKDPLNYIWSCNDGGFPDGDNLAIVKWKSPVKSTDATYTLKISVSDGQYQVEKTLLLIVAKNKPPIITLLSSTPSTGVEGTIFSLRVLAADPESDPLTYKWSCSEGEFPNGDTQDIVKWASPISGLDKTYSLNVKVSDGLNSIERTLEILVSRQLYGSISGYTYFTGCTIPISGVTISAAGKTATTNTDGDFTLTEIPAGKYTIQASKTDYDSYFKEVLVSDNQITNVIISMTSQRYSRKVSGIVKDDENQLIKGAVVVILNPDNSESELRTTTSSAGYYQLPAVPQGQRTIVVTKSPTDDCRYDKFQSSIFIADRDYSFDIEIHKVSYIPVVETYPISAIELYSAASGGEVTYEGENSTVTYRGVCWSTNPTPTFSDNKTYDGSGKGSFLSQLYDLVPNTKYYIRAYAMNNQDKIGYGSILTFCTMPQVSTTEVSQINQHSAISGGSVGIDGGASIVSRGVCWSTTPNPTIYNDKTNEGPGPGNFTSRLTGLNLATTFYLRAYAINESVIGYGAEVSFTTSNDTGIFTDSRDSTIYPWVKIGNQVWMSKNLAYLPAVSPSLSGSDTDPYYYVYDYEGSIISEAKGTKSWDIYGVLYNWKAATTACPLGWHLPSDAEWTALVDYLGGEYGAGGKMKSTGTLQAGTGLWNQPNDGATNSSGFTALPGGGFGYFGDFRDLGSYAFFWSSSEFWSSLAWHRYLSYDSDGVSQNSGYCRYGFSVRCLQN